MSDSLEHIDEIEEIIIAYANGELHRRLEITGARDYRDVIIAGINMLGEELERTTISRDYFMNIYNSVSEVLIILDTEGRIVDMNASAEKILGKTLSDLKHNDIRQVISARFLGLQDELKHVFSLGNNFMSFEAALINNNTEIPILCTISKIIDRNIHHKGYLFIAKDITEQKNKEHHDLKIVIATQEEERKRLANDLHDSLGQEMNAIKMYVNSLAVMDRSSEAYKHALATLTDIIDNSIDSIRNISFNLMPKALENGGLIHAINELVTRIKLLCDVKYNYPDLALNLSKEKEINFFRIIQEFINNSLKHNVKCKIEIHLSYDQGILQLKMKDNGSGFDFTKIKEGNGIHNIKTRLSALEADYIFESIINKGTHLNISMAV